MNPGKIVRALAHERPHAVPLQAGLPRPRDAQPRSTGRPIRAPAAGSRARSRCATTTANAASTSAGVMCPSFRVTGNERDVTRGRANSLRLAISGQLGPDALRLRRDAGDHEAVRLLQGLPARVPDRRRHGQDEDRGAGRRQQAPRAVAARPAGRLPAALCALRRAPRAAHERPQRHPRPRRADRAPHRLLRQAPAAALAPRCVSPRAAARLPAPPRGERVGGGGPTRRTPRLHPTPNPSPSRGGDLDAARRARSRCSPTRSTPTSSRRTCTPPSRCSPASAIASPCSARSTASAAAVLRAHVPVGRPGRGGARRGAARPRRRRAVPRPRRSRSSGWSPPAC